MNRRTILIAASILGLLAVVLGAMGAHALEKVLDPDQLDSFKTAVRYQMWHTLALVALFSMYDHIKHARTVAAFWFSGVLLFSGSIYLLSMQSLWKLDLSWLGPITPLGGMLMITGWVILLIAAFKYK